MSELQLPELATKVKIEDVVPQRVEFKIGKKTYAFKPFTIRDISWVKSKFDKELQEVLAGMDYKEMAMLLFHQLEDKSDFLGSMEEVTDDDGFPATIKVTGPDKLADRLGAQGELMDIFKALMESCGTPKELIDEVFANHMPQDVKKKEVKKKK